MTKDVYQMGSFMPQDPQRFARRIATKRTMTIENAIGDLIDTELAISQKVTESHHVPGYLVKEERDNLDNLKYLLPDLNPNQLRKRLNNK